MSSDWVSAVRFFLTGLAWAAARTATTADDEAVKFLQHQIDNQDFVAWINTLLGADHEPHMFGAAAADSAPASVQEAAGKLNIDWARFLSETLPAILSLVKLFVK